MRTARLAAAALLALLVVVGCSGDNPKPAPVPSQSVSTTPSPALPTPPAVPTAASEHSPEGLEAFARHYIEAINYAIQTGDTNAMREPTLPTCRSCEAIASNIEKVYAGGGSIETQGWKVRSYQSLGLKPESDTAIIGLTVDQLPTMTKHTPTEQATLTKKVRRAFTLYLSPHDTGWRVGQLDLVSPR